MSKGGSGVSLLSRAILGTAQLGLAYGRRSGLAPLEESEAYELLGAAWDIGFRVFDTADVYGSSATRLARWLRAGNKMSDSSVITKVATEHATDESRVRTACARFEGIASLTLLSHGPLEAERFADFRALGNAVGVSVGQSVYTAAEIREAARAGCTHVQAPANVFDARQIDAARESAIALDVRSLFLQGVLLDHPDVAEQRVPGGGVLAAKVRAAALEAEVPPAAALIAAVLGAIGNDDRVVVGIDVPDQLDDVVTAFELSPDRTRAFLEALDMSRSGFNPDPRLLDPRTWTLSQ